MIINWLHPAQDVVRIIMKKAYLRFYAELNDYLPVEKRQKSFIHYFTLNPSIKDIIEACGVPHPEIDIILVNNESVDFNYTLKDEDSVSIYPVFESLDVSPLIRLRARPLRVTRFIVDETLGKLVNKLRLFGFDSIYENTKDMNNFIEKALSDKRIILTKSQGLLKYKRITHGYWVRAIEANEQIKEIISRFDLHAQINPFERCMVCNGQIKPVSKDSLSDVLAENTKKYFNDFWQCTECKKIYWQGSHYQKMLEQLNRIIPGDE